MSSKADLIKRALGGHHLSPFLPDGDHKLARSTVVSTHGGWGGAGSWGNVTPKGIVETDGPRGDIITFIPWKEVFETIARGATPERVERYERAVEWFSDYHARQPSIWASKKDDPRKVPYSPEWEADREEWSAMTDELHAAQDAIIDAGCEQATSVGENLALF